MHQKAVVTSVNLTQTEIISYFLISPTEKILTSTKAEAIAKTARKTNIY